MHGIAVAVLTENRESQGVLQSRVNGTHVARLVFSHVGFPLAATDPIIRQIQDQHVEVVIVDLTAENAQRAIHAIELLRATTVDLAVFAHGNMQNPMAIVSAMRAGASEYLDCDGAPEAFNDAFTNFTATRTRKRGSAGKARVFTIVNAKGGAGATTLAVNTALALQQHHGQTALIDFAPIGHAALHLNLRPSFGVTDALQNLHRMDASLLDGLMTPTKEGLHLLAGSQQPDSAVPTAGELARLFDLLVNHYRYVIVDCSGRVDATTRLLSDLSNTVLMVAQTDVVSLWSTGHIRPFLEESAGRSRLRLVLNRYKKIPGFTEEDVEKATNTKILWKVPNNFQFIGPAIDKGEPVAAMADQEVSRSFRQLAELLAEAAGSSEGGLDLVYKHEKADDKKKSAGRLFVSPLRANQ